MPTMNSRFMFISPRHAHGGDWPWLSQIGSMKRLNVQSLHINNNYEPMPKATRAYIWLQYLNAMRAARRMDLTFLFSTSIAKGMTSWPSYLLRRPRRIYVGFTQDAEWSVKKIQRLARALKRCDAITVFSDDERELYIQRYGLDARHVHVIPIHTDETDGYRQYSDTPPMEQPYVLSLGSPNRRFMPVAKACLALKIPLVIITRPHHQNDSLTELAAMGATIITDADKNRSLTYLKHARLATMVFQTPTLPGAFTTLVHAMYLRTSCVVSSCLGMSDYIVDGETGVITPHGDDAALQAAIELLWNDQPLRDTFAAAGFERAVRLFSVEAAAERFSQLAEQVLQNAARARSAPQVIRPVMRSALD